MRRLFGAAALAAAALSLCGPAAATSAEGHRSPYAGQESREIKALSPQDVDDLLNGRGWGFAKAAELNGMPGPAHLLELADEIGLSAQQRRAVEDLFDAMRSEAIALGRSYVALERRLDRAFAERTITPETLARDLAAIAEVRGRLRLVHLRAHLQTAPLLSRHQTVLYNRLRGYDGPAGSGHHEAH